MSELPENLQYSAEHEWVDASDPAIIGITAHAAEELGEIVFVELPAVGTTVAAGDSCGEIESTKAVSEIYAPVAGEIIEVNTALDDAPETVGEDPYGQGWLFKVKVTEAGPLLDAAAYQALIDA